MDSTKDTPCEKRVGLFNGLHRHRGPCVEEGAPVTRPVGVLDPAPPKGCSCVGLMTDSDQILTKSPNPRTATGRTSASKIWCFLAPTWSFLAVLSAMFVHLVQPGSYLAPTWSLFGPTWPNLAPTWSNLVPSWPNLAPTWSNFGPNLVQHGPKI